jgi:hypothetical protein
MKEKKLYTVQWEIELFARCPKDAAREARKIQMDPNNRADHFTVHNDDRTKEIDLSEGE